MKKRLYTLIIFLSFISTSAYAGDEGGVVFRCGIMPERQFLSATILERGNQNIHKSVSKIKRKIARAEGLKDLLGISSDTQGLRLIEDAVVRSEGGSINRMDRIRRLSQLDKTCTPIGVTILDELIKFGLPPVVPVGPVHVGSRWRRDLTILYQRNEFPIRISYTLEKVEKMLDREVAVFGLMLSGLEDIDGSKNRWAGIGRELWDISDGYPLLRILEIKRGKSFVKDVDLSLSYSESVLF